LDSRPTPRVSAAPINRSMITQGTPWLKSLPVPGRAAGAATVSDMGCDGSIAAAAGTAGVAVGSSTPVAVGAAVFVAVGAGVLVGAGSSTVTETGSDSATMASFSTNCAVMV